MSTEFSPIFIMSSERSGTNLLRMLLDNHPSIHGPRAPQLLKSFSVYYPYYLGPQGIQKEEVLKDIESVVNHSYIEWGVSLDGMANRIPDSPSFLDFWSLLYEVKANQMGVSHIVCKEIDIFNYAAQLKNHIPRAKFIYLHRDVRDVVASWMRLPTGYKNVNQAARSWNKEQMKCIENSLTFGLEVHRVAYEDLVADTPRVMTGVLEHIGIEVDPACFNTNPEKGKTQNWNKAWKNLSSEVIKTNTKKYKDQFSEDELLLIETRAQRAMDILGYTRETEGEWTPPEQPLLNRVLSKWAFQTAKPAYKNKVVQDKIEKLDGFREVFASIGDRLMEGNK